MPVYVPPTRKGMQCRSEVEENDAILWGPGNQIQFSMFNFGTLLNSLELFVTKIKSSESAWAAIIRSYSPIRVPFFSKNARISPNLMAAFSSKGIISMEVQKFGKSQAVLSFALAFLHTILELSESNGGNTNIEVGFQAHNSWRPPEFFPCFCYRVSLYYKLLQIYQ